MRAMRKFVAILLSVLTCMSMIGCSAGMGGGQYEGAKMQFKYKASDWNVTYRTANDDNTIIELTAENGSGLSILSCEADTTGPEEIYKGMVTADELLGEISNTSSSNNMSEDGGLAAYAHLVKTNFMGDYWTLLYGKNAGEGKILLAAATVYVDPEDEKAADKCKEAIQGVVDSLKVSEKAETGSITESVIEADVQSSVLKNFITGGKVEYDYMKEATASQGEPKSLDGFTYVKEVELADGVSKQPVTVYAPYEEEKGFDGYGVYYYGHGVSFSVFVLGDWIYQSAEECVSDWIKDEATSLKEESTRYQNVEVEDLVTVEEELCYYQHISAEELDYQENPFRNDYLVYVGTAENGIGYQFQLQISGQSTDAETNTILEELGKCYDLDLVQYGNSDEDLTNSGQLMDPAQDVYIQSPSDPEVIKADDYTYMGTSEISDYDGNIYELMILMGKNTSNSGSSLSGIMHGISMHISVGTSYGDINPMERVQQELDYQYESYLNNSRDYKNPVMGELASTTEGEGVYGATSADRAGYEGDIYPYHEISYCLLTGEKEYISMSLTLDERDFDSKTNDVLKDIEKAYRMDLSEFYYEP